MRQITFSLLYSSQSRVVLLILCLILSTYRSAAIADTYVSGDVSQNMTWEESGSPYFLIGNLTVGRETFWDMNDNNQWDSDAEEFSDFGEDKKANTNDFGESNGRYDYGEPFVDAYPNGKWDPREPFNDINRNNRLDKPFVLKIRPGVKVMPRWGSWKILVNGALDASGAAFESLESYEISINTEQDGEAHLNNCVLNSGAIKWQENSRGSIVKSIGTSQIIIKSSDVILMRNRLPAVHIIDAAPDVSDNIFTSSVPYALSGAGAAENIMNNTYISKKPSVLLSNYQLKKNDVWKGVDGIKNYEIQGDIIIGKPFSLIVGPDVTLRAIGSTWTISVKGNLEASKVTFAKSDSYQLNLRAESGGEMDFYDCSFNSNRIEWEKDSRGSVKNSSGTPQMINKTKIKLINNQFYKSQNSL